MRCLCRKEAEERAARLQQQLQQKKMEVKQLKADMQEAIHARCDFFASTLLQLTQQAACQACTLQRVAFIIAAALKDAPTMPHGFHFCIMQTATQILNDFCCRKTDMTISRHAQCFHHLIVCFHRFAKPEAASSCCCRNQAQELAKELQKELKVEEAKNKHLKADLKTTTQDR